MNIADIRDGDLLYATPRRWTASGWIYAQPRVKVLARGDQQGRGDYVHVEIHMAGQAPDQHWIHVDNLRVSPPSAPSNGDAPVRTLPGKPRHIAPEHGEELSLLDLLEEA